MDNYNRLENFFKFYLNLYKAMKIFQISSYETEYLNCTDPVIDSRCTIRTKLGSVRHIAGFLASWGMCIASYPFIGHVAEATGRLLRLQSEVQAVQVNQRIREKFGDRHFVHRSVRYNLSTFLDLGALKQGTKKGVYVKGNVYRPKSDIEIAWLIEAVMHMQANGNLPFTHLSQHGALFPFNITDLSANSLKKNPRIEIFRHGLNEELVGIKDK
jgi:hypothetical protein